MNENIPPSLVDHLMPGGYDSIHSFNAGIQFTSINEYVIITHYLEDGRIISLSGEAKPSVITFRQKSISLKIIAESLMIALPKIKEIL